MTRFRVLLVLVPLFLLTAPQPSSAHELGRTRIVRMNALQFVPAKLTIHVGDRVVWQNVSDVAHTVTTLRSKASNPRHASVPKGVKGWDSGFVFKGERYARTFAIAGMYRYFCIPHEGAGMVGTIVVTR